MEWKDRESAPVWAQEQHEMSMHPEITAGTMTAGAPAIALDVDLAGVGIQWIRGIIGMAAGLETLPDELVVQPVMPPLPATHVPRDAITSITPEDRFVPLPARFIVRVDYQHKQRQESLRLAPLGSDRCEERDLLLHRLVTWRELLHKGI